MSEISSTPTPTPTPTIKPMNIPADQLEILKDALVSKRYIPASKDRLLSKISGRCCVCGSIPTQIASYDCAGATRIERYCDACVEKTFSRTLKGVSS